MFSLIDFLKEITNVNVKIRYESQPLKIYPHTIGKFNIEKINKKIELITKIDDFNSDDLSSVFTKGIKKLFDYAKFIEKTVGLELTHNQVFLLIAQYLVLNQVFGDGNHRTTISVLKKYTTYLDKEIGSIMKITERIHVWRGDLHESGLWTRDGDNLIPNIQIICSYPDTKTFFM